MIKKIFCFMVLTVSSFLSAQIEYEIKDIGTLQTHSSQGIAINSKGQILGWYNIDGTPNGKHFFIRDQDGSFSELPRKENGEGWDIDWRYLTDNGRAYGTFDGNSNFSVLYIWDRNNGVFRLGNLPGKEVLAINNAGQVLIRSMEENENGRSIRRPVIWQNGQITKLKGLEGDLGIESNESYGFDMNNYGEVVGESIVDIVYKNNVHRQTHATKWVNGKAIDLNHIVPKTNKSSATAINDQGDIFVNEYLIRKDNPRQVVNIPSYTEKINNNFMFSSIQVHENNGLKLVTRIDFLTNKIRRNPNSIWYKTISIISINNNGEIIAQGETIYGEQHAMFLCPIVSSN